MESAGWLQTKRYFRDFILSDGKSESTANTYIANLSMFWRWCAQYEITPYEADHRLLRSWSAERKTLVSSARAHNELAAVRKFYSFLIDNRDREDDPTVGIRVKRRQSLPTEPLGDEELGGLIKGCADERDRMIILLLATTGMRISELAGIRAEHIDWKRGTIKILGKGNKEREITPRPDVLSRLHAFTGMFPVGPILLSKQNQTALAAHQIRKILYGLAERTKLPGVHPHRLRATFATQFMEKFADLQALQGMMGHESPETTARYAESTKMRRGQEYMKRLRYDFEGDS